MRDGKRGDNSQSNRRSYNVPVHGQDTIANAATNRMQRDALVNHELTSLPPAHTRAIGSPTSGVCPCLVGCLEQVIDRLARHIAVDEYFGQTLRQLRGRIHIKRIPSKRQGLRALGVEQYLGAAASDFIAG